MFNLALYPNILRKSALKGFLAFLVLLAAYFSILTLVSGSKFAWEQFTQYWYFILSLSLGFGIQFTLYGYLKSIIKERVSGRQLVATGTTSTVAMISCCAHYLTNILPILGATGIIVFISQYQVQFFWVGLIFNLFGILYIGNKVANITGLKINKAVVFYSLLILVMLFFLAKSVSINIGSKGTAAGNETPGVAQGSSGLQTQENDDGGIAVVVTPKGFDNNSGTWDFEVSINNHAVSIDADMVAVSELLDDQGKLYKPVSWEGSSPGGHHLNGVLKFNAISPKPKSIELRIKDIGGVSERSFKWSL